jgi:hypothetical protein
MDLGESFTGSDSKALLRQTLSEIVANAAHNGVHRLVIADQLLCVSLLMAMSQDDDGTAWIQESIDLLGAKKEKLAKFAAELTGNTPERLRKEELARNRAANKRKKERTEAKAKAKAKADAAARVVH